MHFSEEEKKLSFRFKQKVKCSFSTCIRGGEKKTMFSLSKRNFWAFFAGIAKRKFSPGTPFFSAHIKAQYPAVQKVVNIWLK